MTAPSCGYCHSVGHEREACPVLARQPATAVCDHPSIEVCAAEHPEPGASTIPPGYEKNSAADRAELAAATTRALLALRDLKVRAVAMVFVMPDGKVTASLAGEDLDAFARLAHKGPEVLRVIIARLLRGDVVG